MLDSGISQFIVRVDPPTVNPIFVPPVIVNVVSPDEVIVPAVVVKVLNALFTEPPPPVIIEVVDPVEAQEHHQWWR